MYMQKSFTAHRHVNHPGYQLRSGFATDLLRSPEQH
jgi:hypothetical protein